MNPKNIDPASGRSRKSAEAYRTISEVADELHVPQHVLRFWETKFPRIKPLKRGGGRRYYRPDDVVLLRRISDLLYIQGYTIKGVQRLLKEGGGMLHEHIPPASLEEREAAEAERVRGRGDEPDLLASLPVGASKPAEKASEKVTEPRPSNARPPTHQLPAEQKLAQVRIALQETLLLLEALRASLD